jgi:hypothetical protein
LAFQELTQIFPDLTTTTQEINLHDSSESRKVQMIAIGGQAGKKSDGRILISQSSLEVALNTFQGGSLILRLRWRQDESQQKFLCGWSGKNFGKHNIATS